MDFARAHLADLHATDPALLVGGPAAISTQTHDLGAGIDLQAQPCEIVDAGLLLAVRGRGGVEGVIPPCSRRSRLAVGPGPRSQQREFVRVVDFPAGWVRERFKSLPYECKELPVTAFVRVRL